MRIGICSIDKVDYDHVSVKLEARCPARIFVNGANDIRVKGSMRVHASAPSFCTLIVALNIVCMSAISQLVCILSSMDVHCWCCYWRLSCASRTRSITVEYTECSLEITTYFCFRLSKNITYLHSIFFNYLFSKDIKDYICKRNRRNKRVQ